MFFARPLDLLRFVGVVGTLERFKNYDFGERRGKNCAQSAIRSFISKKHATARGGILYKYTIKSCMEWATRLENIGGGAQKIYPSGKNLCLLQNNCIAF